VKPLPTNFSNSKNKQFDMALFAVKREIDAKFFLKDEDRISADNWEAAEIILMQGIASGRYDKTCVLDGEIVYEEEISDDATLDIMIDNNQHKNIPK
jgi:hypothetical protein